MWDVGLGPIFYHPRSEIESASQPFTSEFHPISTAGTIWAYCTMESRRNKHPRDEDVRHSDVSTKRKSSDGVVSTSFPYANIRHQYLPLPNGQQ